MHCVHYFYLFTDAGYCSEDEDEEDKCDEDMEIPWHDNTMFEMFRKWLESPCGKKKATTPGQTTCQTGSGSNVCLQSTRFQTVLFV